MHGRTPRALLAFFAILGLGAVQPAFAWWSDDWAFRKELTFDTTPTAGDVAETSADVPVLVRLSLANFPYFADAKPDGSDLRFIAADDKTPLKHHVEKYDSQAQIALIWLRLPQLAGNAKTDKVYLYYGNAKSAAANDAAGSYDGKQSLVWHFAEAPGPVGDATGYKNEPQGLSPEISAASLIGQGLKFDGQHTISAAASASLRLDPAQGLTLSGWFKPTSGQSNAVLLRLADGGKAVALAMNGLRAEARWTTAGERAATAMAASDVAVDAWHHLAVRAAGRKLTLIVDGAVAAEVDVKLEAMGGEMEVGREFRGELDEVQIAATARSNGWLRAAARSQGIDAPVLVYGGDTQKEGGQSESYFSSTLRNVTIDGWIIIAILAVLFVLSTLIMIFKIVRLTAVGSGNARFLTDYHKMRDDPAAIEGEFGSSTLWRLYHAGMQEALKRLQGQAAGADRVRKLSPQSIEAIRSAMDASQTRLTQGLQAQMVWLTISISGGPFLGLLGTVVGVMITFAAIAASGEVNVNAIAPGTAAALVATVAGLGVAIPCLFGYNYLNTRIKDIATDMRVFVDEFIARLAETYT